MANKRRKLHELGIHITPDCIVSHHTGTVDCRGRCAMTGIPSWARKGTPVVCVDDWWIGASTPLSKGGVYTLRGVVIDEYPYKFGRYQDSTVLVQLVQCKNPTDFINGAFAIARFKPLISKPSEAQEQADIEMFKRLLKPSSIPSERLDAFLAELGVL